MTNLAVSSPAELARQAQSAALEAGQRMAAMLADGNLTEDDISDMLNACTALRQSEWLLQQAVELEIRTLAGQARRPYATPIPVSMPVRLPAMMES